MKYVIADWETSTKVSYKRKANPFDLDNYIVAHGLKYTGEEAKTWYMEDLPTNWLDDVDFFIAHNASFDMLYKWEDPTFKAWLKAGGKIWCTQYAEYLLTGQQTLYPSLDQCSAKYGGVLKNDEIKAFWESGIDTIDIPQDMIIDYLIGDLDNTEIVFKAQMKKATELGMMASIHTHMEALLCLTEMEFNGLYIDKPCAEAHMVDLNARLLVVREKLDEYIPKLPEEVTWNWGSKDHLSALMFGGKIRYKRRIHKMDDDGNLMYTKVKEDWPLVDGEPLNPISIIAGNPPNYDRYKSGKKAGSIKYKKVDVQGEPKMKFEDFFAILESNCTPDQKWMTKNEGVFQTGEDVLTSLTNRNIGGVLPKLLLEWRNIDKDLGTYYKRYDPRKKTEVGMLTLVQPDGIIHHKLNNCATVTGRLSSSDPNLQNVPSSRKSKVKDIFKSRFGETNGKMGETDFSQLEVVVKGLLSKDPNLIRDLQNKVDFHCRRLSTKLGEPYEDVLRKAKEEKIQEYVDGRQDSKEFSFQRAFGAGAPAISESTGIPIDEVKDYIKAEEEAYPLVVEYDNQVIQDIADTRTPTNKRILIDGQEVQLGRGYHISPTGKRYVFWESMAPDFMRKPKWRGRKPVLASFTPTEAKNYPTQGCSGEFVLLCLGKLFREFLARDNFGGKALLVNSVHDCVWADMHVDVVDEAACLIHDVLEDAPKHIEERYGFDVPVPFPVETEIGTSMLTLEHYK